MSYCRFGPYEYCFFSKFTNPGIAIDTFEIFDIFSLIILDIESINFSSFSGVGILSFFKTL